MLAPASRPATAGWERSAAFGLHPAGRPAGHWRARRSETRGTGFVVTFSSMMNRQIINVVSWTPTPIPVFNVQKSRGKLLALHATAKHFSRIGSHGVTRSAGRHISWLHHQVLATGLQLSPAATLPTFQRISFSTLLSSSPDFKRVFKRWPDFASAANRRTLPVTASVVIE